MIEVILTIIFFCKHGKISKKKKNKKQPVTVPKTTESFKYSVRIF